MKQITLDGFVNLLKGLGTSKDPTETAYFQPNFPITYKLANDIYIYNWLARKVIDIPVDDALREWRTLLISDPVKKKNIEDAIINFDIKVKLSTALKWARLYGGAAIIAIVDGENQEDELNINNLTGKLSNFIVLDRYNIYPGKPDRDILSKNFGEPKYYTVSRDGVKIHHTRVLKIKGALSTIYEYELNNYWGSSILSYIFEPIRDSQVLSKNIGSLIYESNVDVYKIDGLNSMIAAKEDDLAIKRLKLAHSMKSNINGIALDANDEYDKKSNTFSGLAELDDRAIQKVSGASEIPVTRLVGISPSGMNATGESDKNNYNDFIQAYRENRIRPKLKWIDSLITANLGINEGIEFEFRPLVQLDEESLAELEVKRAQRDQIYLDLDILRSTDILAQLSENGTYVTIDAERVEQEKKAEDFDIGQENGEE